MQKIGFIAVASSDAASGLNGALPGSLDVAKGLARLLISTRKLCHQSLYCHWQAMEPEFPGLHSLFEQHYQSLRNATDVIAGRIHDLGYELPSQFSESVWGTSQDDARPQQEMIEGLIRNHCTCAHESKMVIKLAENAGDEYSMNLASQRQIMHKKCALLLSTLTEENIDDLQKPTRSLM